MLASLVVRPPITHPQPDDPVFSVVVPWLPALSIALNRPPSCLAPIASIMLAADTSARIGPPSGTLELVEPSDAATANGVSVAMITPSR
jgi:hypothetical protein